MRGLEIDPRSAGGGGPESAALPEERELSGDARVSREVEKTVRRIEEQGGKVLSVQLAGELAESLENHKRGDDTRDPERDWARSMRLPLGKDGKVCFPSAQIFYESKDGFARENLWLDGPPEENVREPVKPRSRAGGRRARATRRRERDPRRERISFDERKRGALADAATYRVVSVKDLVDQRFGGNAFAARKGIEDLKRRGWIEEHTVQVRSGKTFRVLTATERGAEQARQNDPGRRQRYWSGIVKPKELRHDAAVYRAARAEIEKLEKAGARVLRVRLDYELKAKTAQASESARAKDGDLAAQQARRQAAEELGLPLDEKGRVTYPDARIEYEDERGMAGRVDVEVTSGNYRSQEIRAKAAAGFALHANGRSARRTLAAALGRDGSKRGGRPRKDDEWIEL